MRRQPLPPAAAAASAATAHTASCPADCSACGKLAFISKAPVSRQPKRGADGSFVLKASLLAKSSMHEGEKKLIKREKGVEKQFRWSCTGEGCGLTLGYQSTPWLGDAKCIFVLPGALAVTATDGAGGHGAVKSSLKTTDSGSAASKAVQTAAEQALDLPLNSFSK